MTAAAAWRGVFIERLKATGNVTLAASGAGVARQHAYRTRNRSWPASRTGSRSWPK